MTELFACVLIAFGIAYMLIPEIIKIAHAYEIHDTPNERKLHSQKIPRFGGVAIFFGFVIATLLLSYVQHFVLNVQFVVGVILVVIVGFRDDFLALRPSIKLVGEVAAALLVLYSDDLSLGSLHGLLGIYELPTLLGYAISVFTVIVILNAFNLMDGIDGLAGSVGLLFFATFGTLFFLTGDLTTSMICFSLCGAIVAFLYYNLRKRIFMGDAGSLLLGFVAAVVALRFFKQYNHADMQAVWTFRHPVVFVSCAMVYPLFDTIRVFVLRLREGRSPFSPDKLHIHHVLVGSGLSHLQATGIILAAHSAFLGLGFAVQPLMFNENLGILAGVGLCMGLTWGLGQYAKHSAKPTYAAKADRDKPQATRKLKAKEQGGLS